MDARDKYELTHFKAVNSLCIPLFLKDLFPNLGTVYILSHNSSPSRQLLSHLMVSLPKLLPESRPEQCYVPIMATDLRIFLEVH